MNSNNNRTNNGTSTGINPILPLQHRIDGSINAITNDYQNYEEVMAKIKKADNLAESKLAKMKAFEQIVNEKIKDNSPAARNARLKRTIRAAYGEFMCTLLFLFPQFCVNINGHIKNYDSAGLALQISLVAGFSAVAVSFAFAPISGGKF